MNGVVFNLTANIRKKADCKFVYNIEMRENKEIELSSPQDSQNSGRNGIPNSSIISVTDIENDVNRQYSLGTATINKQDAARDLRAILSRNRNSTAREILEAAHSQGQNDGGEGGFNRREIVGLNIRGSAEAMNCIKIRHILIVYPITIQIVRSIDFSG